MAIVTSSNRIHFDVMHRSSGITEFMEFCQCSEEIGVWKPKPDPYLHAVKRAGVDPARCLVVEDSERGLAAAVAADLRAWVIPHALSEGGTFAGAERVLSSIREIPPLVAAQNG
jgi:HAD superfamily hydrolase (TIGR01509 family)